MQYESWLNEAVMGAICGDVLGSIYEMNNLRCKLPWEQLLKDTSTFTDDTVMTCAVVRGLMRGLTQLPRQWQSVPGAEQLLTEQVRDAVAEYGLRYPEAGYGRSFIRWLNSADHEPYNSWGNGSAMRASYPGWIAESLEEAEKLAEISAVVTHNHPEGVKGAKVVAGCVFLLRQGGGKEAVRAYTEQFYPLDFTLDGIRDSYVFDVSCQGSVPQGIQAFLEAGSYEDAVTGAISIGGDSDTLAAIAGALAEIVYPIPPRLREEAARRLDAFLLDTLKDAADFLRSRRA